MTPGVAATVPRAVAEPVLRRSEASGGGVVRGVGSSAAYVDLGDFVLALTGRGVPLMPNGVAVPGAWSTTAAGLRAGARARIAPGRIQLAGLDLRWSPATPPAWDPRIRALPGTALRGLLGGWPPERQAADAAELSVPAERTGREAFGAVVEGVRRRDPGSIAEAARVLVGRGPGLTPEGDDLLCGVGAALHAFGGGAGLRGHLVASLAEALCLPAPERRTTALSATLLRLAVRGLVAEPLLRLGDGAGASAERVRRGLIAVGHSTGRAYAVGLRAGAAALAEVD